MRWHFVSLQDLPFLVPGANDGRVRARRQAGDASAALLVSGWDTRPAHFLWASTQWGTGLPSEFKTVTSIRPSRWPRLVGFGENLDSGFEFSHVVRELGPSADEDRGEFVASRSKSVTSRSRLYFMPMS